MIVEVKSKVIPTSFLKIQERETFVGAKDRRKCKGFVEQRPLGVVSEPETDCSEAEVVNR